MKHKKRIIIGLVVFLLAIVGVCVGVKHYIDIKVANNERIVATSAAISEIFEYLKLI